VASYSPIDGQSDPSSAPPTHAWGRANAAEAVGVADRGVDLFVRDNRLDWGNTERSSGMKFSANSRQFIPWWESVDIKVDAPDSSGSFQSAPSDSSGFRGLTEEDPIADEKNRVYVRIRNRGPQDASDVKVTLYYAFAGTGLPRFNNLTEVKTKNVGTFPYSGPSVAGSTNDPAGVIQFEWDAPKINVNQTDPTHYCLLAAVENADDKLNSTSGAVANLVPSDNNMTLNNVNVTPRLTGTSLERFYIRNPFDGSINTTLEVGQPDGWSVDLNQGGFGEVVRLSEGEKRLREVNIEPNGDPGVVRIRQEVVREGPNRVVGGMTYRFREASDGD